MVYINDCLDELDLDTALPLLPDERRQKALAFKHELGRRQSVAVWMLLRQGCREVFGLEDVPSVAYGEHGKPYFPEHPDMHFNMSHCRHAVACVVSRQPVGIDIESIRKFDTRLVRYVLNDEEYKAYAESEQPDLTFTQFWTRKESLLKLTGHGLTTDLKSVLTTHPDVLLNTVVLPEQRYVYTVARYMPRNSG